MNFKEGMIFLSYAREDEDIATKLYDDLSQVGLNVWFDKKSLPPGKIWLTAIKRAIRESRYFISLLSNKSVSKIGIVQKEILEAIELHGNFPETETYIIPVRINDCEPSHLKLHDFQWVDLFPSYDAGVSKLIEFFSLKQIEMTIAILQEANWVEIGNAIDKANASQTSYFFKLHPEIIQFDEPGYVLSNEGIDFDNLIDDLVLRKKTLQDLVSKKPILVTSLPYSSKELLKEFKGKSLIEELSQCYFHQIFEYPTGNIAVISTYIWDHLPSNNIELPKSPSGRRALEPFLLSEFAAIVLDPLADLPFHEETQGCPFDYCNDVRDIDESFRKKRLCDEHLAFLSEQVAKARITKQQMDSAIKLFEKAFGKN